ncbi:MAG: GNAT family N-acetyltransferase [Rhodothermales bacterium]|nr:GNAT family N-acetyltransferase [Rhodothermales bacterium]
MTAASHLDTERLVLRPVRPGDVERLHRHWTAPDVRRYLWDDAVIPRPQVEEVVQASDDLFRARRGGLWMLRLKPERAFVGCGGYWYFHEPPQREFVLSLDADAWGQGLATEAGWALLTYGFTALDLDEVQASTDPPNAASVRLMERLGMSFARRADSGGRQTVFYRLARSDWERGRAG